MATVKDMETGRVFSGISDYAASQLIKSNPKRYKADYSPIVKLQEETFGSAWAGTGKTFTKGSSFSDQKVPTEEKRFPPRYGSTPYDADALSGEELEMFAHYRNHMQDNPDMYFSYDADGAPVWRSNAYTEWERMVGDTPGFTDKVAGALQEWMRNQAEAGAEDWQDPAGLPDLGLGGGSGGGGGGRAVGPTYVPPDRRVIEDMVKSQLVALTGDYTDQRISELADLFFADHKQDWENRVNGQGSEVDPQFSVLAAIRDQSDYKRIHAMRPESEDETRWIQQQRIALQQRGVDPGDAEEQAIWMAQTGQNPMTLETGVSQNAKGAQDIGLFRNIKQAAERVGRAL